MCMQWATKSRIAFREAGFNVVNLGVLVSQKEFVEAALNKR